jgi:hypothetical protein
MEGCILGVGVGGARITNDDDACDLLGYAEQEAI